jgi:hypothetical protein
MPTPFTIAVSDAELADLKDRLRRTQVPEDMARDIRAFYTQIAE